MAGQEVQVNMNAPLYPLLSYLPQGEPVVITDEVDVAEAVVSQVPCFSYAII